MLVPYDRRGGIMFNGLSENEQIYLEFFYLMEKARFWNYLHSVV